MGQTDDSSAWCWLKRPPFLLCLFVCGLVVSACSSGQDSAGPSPSPTLSVGGTIFVQDHAYTDEVYSDIKQSGAHTYPAQTTDKQPDRSFHFIRPFGCTVEEVTDDGFIRCKLQTTILDPKEVWTNRALTEDEARTILGGRAPSTTDSPAVAIAPAKKTASSRRWLEQRSGQQAYTKDDGGNANFLTVCTTTEEYRDFYTGDNSVAGCTHRKPGQLVTLLKFAPDRQYDPSGRTTEVFAYVAGAGWSGYAHLDCFEPIIPKKTQLTCTKMGDADILLFASQHSPYFGTDHIVLASPVHIEVLHHYPYSGDSDDFVEVLDGKGAGKTGFMLMSGCTTADTHDDADMFIGAIS